MKRGFTLIELLAVIVILAIIALIAVPIVLNIIEDTKKNAFEQSVNGIVKSATLKASMELKTEELSYRYENNNWVENKLNIDGQTPKYVEIKVNKKGQTRYAITDGKYCITKEYDSKKNIKKVGNENNDKTIEEEYCKLDALLPTDESCFKYTEHSESVSITGYYCYKGNNKGYPEVSDVIIPEKIEGKQVTNIVRAFSGKELTSVVIPNSVYSIGDSAFSYNNLTKVIIPESVTSIGSAAFWDNQLTSIEIPNSVTSIGASAFRDNKLTSVVIPNSVTSIGAFAFEGNSLTHITIPNSVTSIGAGAFTNNQFLIDQAYIYNRNSDGSINYSSLNSYGGKEKNIQIPSEVNGVELTNIGAYSFNDSNLINVVIPESVTSIGYSAFNKNSLKSIIIPANVTSIEQYAFSLNSLINVTIKGKLSIDDFTKFGSYVFGWAYGYNDSNIIWEGNN